jgi:hypothetical protein
VVITAAHCLPHLPPAHLDSATDEHTYRSLIGPLGAAAEIWAECLFVDPIADVAVLGPVDGQVFFDGQVEAYEEMLERITPLQIADAPIRGAAWLYSLDGHWFPANVMRLASRFRVYEASEAIRGGMSGSPILRESRKAIGVVSVSHGGEDLETPDEGYASVLTRALPVWLVRELKHPVMACVHCGLDGFHGSLAECAQALRGRAAMLEGKGKVANRLRRTRNEQHH